MRSHATRSAIRLTLAGAAFTARPLRRTAESDAAVAVIARNRSVTAICRGRGRRLRAHRRRAGPAEYESPPEQPTSGGHRRIQVARPSHRPAAIRVTDTFQFEPLQSYESHTHRRPSHRRPSPSRRRSAGRPSHWSRPEPRAWAAPGRTRGRGRLQAPRHGRQRPALPRRLPPPSLRPAAGRPVSPTRSASLAERRPSRS